ncbi:apolipoprotein N-acyltransferase [Nocardioides jensenii]|uniref:apolipoprotein N-acyltransferase n=1 Tax=Nocardioides jensenii TaxID=1843 RepID=UPI00082B5718|nr:apolipoprotein N-acyltransferase [Nocardioides jensenii]
MLRILLALTSGIALGLAFEPVGAVVLLPLALALFFWCTLHQSVRFAALLGLAFGVAFMLTLLFWLRVIGTDAWLALSGFEALYFALAGAGLAGVSRSRLWPLWSAVVWLAVETFRGAWPMSGLTWGRVAFATIDTPFERWFPWIGASGVSLLVALSSALLLWSVLHVRDRQVLAGGVLSATVLTVVVPWFVPVHATSDNTATVAVVQGDVPGHGDDLIAHHREVTASHMQLTQDLAEQVDRGERPRPSFVVWPENTTAVDPFRDLSVRQMLVMTSRMIGVPILVGAIVDAADDAHVLNQGIVFDPVTGAGDRYTKRHPVPFGEYIPYRKHFGASNFGRLAMIPRDMLSGTGVEPLRIDGLRVADVICFDVSYDDTISDQVRRGADLLVVQTSNAMFIHTGQIEQQFAISRLRALETGRTVVVAAVNGRSGVIGPDGNVIAAIEPRTRDVLVQEIRLADGTPPAMVVGPWLGRLSVPLALGAVLLPLLSYRLQRRKRTPDEAEPAPDDQGDDT